MDDHGQEENANGAKISQMPSSKRSISQNSSRVLRRSRGNAAENRLILWKTCDYGHYPALGSSGSRRRPWVRADKETNPLYSNKSSGGWGIGCDDTLSFTYRAK